MEFPILRLPALGIWRWLQKTIRTFETPQAWYSIPSTRIEIHSQQFLFLLTRFELFLSLDLGRVVEASETHWLASFLVNDISV